MRTELSARLAQPDAALQNLLDALLVDVATDAPAGGARAPAAAAAPTRPTAQDPVLNTEPAPPLTEPGVAQAPLPAWAVNGFRALLFRIGEFRFALPLVLMRGVAPGEERLGKIPGLPAWHLGAMHSRGALVNVADLGQLVGIDAHCTALRYLLLIGDGRVALGCDALEDAVVVDSAQVRWQRHQRAGRAWLAGLLVQQMCLLLDADALAQAMRHD
ncbi:MAG: chemotaxis protein CheW [Gammaproteobacteria bacterium]|nr:chemotaxis protein CheW [Gammaproteobacteria bacterium]